MDSQDAYLLVKQLQKLPPYLMRVVKLEICNGKWSELFPPISDYCNYTEDIKEKQTSFVENAIDNVIRGNEVITIRASINDIQIQGEGGVYKTWTLATKFC